MNSLLVKKPILELEIGLRGETVLILKYNYEGNILFANDLSTSFTLFEEKGDKFIFRKYYRDFDWEKQCSNTLGELGFFSDDDINFFPLSAENKRKDNLYSFLETVNSLYTEITDSGFTLSSRLNLNYNLKPVNIEISSQIVNDWFDLKATVKIGEWEIPFNRFKRNILEGIREYELPDGSIAILPETWFSKYKNIFEFGKSSEESLKIHKQHFSLLSDSFENDWKKEFDRLEKLLVPGQIPAIQPPRD